MPTVQTVSKATHAAITAAAQGQEQAARKWVKAVDLLQADGIDSAMIETAKKGGSDELRDSIKQDITASFNKDDQTLLNSPTAGLTDVKKLVKKTLQQKIGSTLGHIQRLLKARESEGEDAEA